jgi:hypothetical protein
MIKSTDRSEQGQSLVVLVLAAVILVGAAGMALDGGFILTQKRRAQNVADNAALAAALKLAQKQYSDYVPEAIQVAQQNEFVVDATTVITVTSPPETGAFTSTPFGQYVEVIITRQVHTSFIHLLYTGPFAYTVHAVARAEPSDLNRVAEGLAIVALDEDYCEATFFSGSSDIYIDGGGVFSNSSGGDPGDQCYSGQISGSGNVYVEDGEVLMVEDWNSTGGGTVSPEPITGVDPIDYPPIPDPPCDGVGMTDKGDVDVTNNNGEIIGPGRYDDISVNPGGYLTMTAGLYCIMGGNFSIGGSVYGIAVHIYMGPDAGSFETNAGSQIELRAATEANCSAPAPTTPDVCDQAWLLLHVDEENTNLITINGGADTTYVGTILAPGAQININGGSATGGIIQSQIIGAVVEVQGTADIIIEYDPAQNYVPPLPPRVWLAE